MMDRLRHISDALFLADNPIALDEAALELHSLLSAVSGINNDPADSSYSLNTALTVGEAISPEDAARCLIDSARTSKFLRGIATAVREAQRRFPDRPLEILYAGCGPFATLAIPLTTRFHTDQIQFTLLDMHARSLACAEHVIQAFGLTNYVREYIQGDAASYLHPRPLHMVICEATQKALSKEPQVAIALNLSAQLYPGGIFIPERIAVDAHLCDPREELMNQRAARVRLGSVLELTAEKAIEMARMGDNRRGYAGAYLPTVTMELPEEVAEGLKLMLSTTITVYEMISLGEYESGLTHPLWFYDFSGVQGGRRIEFQYRISRNPGFTWQMSV